MTISEKQEDVTSKMWLETSAKQNTMSRIFCKKTADQCNAKHTVFSFSHSVANKNAFQSIRVRALTLNNLK